MFLIILQIIVAVIAVILMFKVYRGYKANLDTTILEDALTALKLRAFNAEYELRVRNSAWTKYRQHVNYVEMKVRSGLRVHPFEEAKLRELYEAACGKETN